MPSHPVAGRAGYRRVGRPAPGGGRAHEHGDESASLTNSRPTTALNGLGATAGLKAETSRRLGSSKRSSLIRLTCTLTAYDHLVPEAPTRLNGLTTKMRGPVRSAAIWGAMVWQGSAPANRSGGWRQSTTWRSATAPRGV